MLNKRKRGLALLLCLCMILSCIPSVLAAEVEEQESAEELADQQTTGDGDEPVTIPLAPHLGDSVFYLETEDGKTYRTIDNKPASDNASISLGKQQALVIRLRTDEDAEISIQMDSKAENASVLVGAKDQKLSLNSDQFSYDVTAYLKDGNTLILKGGSETIQVHSLMCIGDVSLKAMSQEKALAILNPAQSESDQDKAEKADKTETDTEAPQQDAAKTADEKTSAESAVTELPEEAKESKPAEEDKAGKGAVEKTEQPETSPEASQRDKADTAEPEAKAESPATEPAKETKEILQPEQRQQEQAESEKADETQTLPDTAKPDETDATDEKAPAATEATEPTKDEPAVKAVEPSSREQTLEEPQTDEPEAPAVKKKAPVLRAAASYEFTSLVKGSQMTNANNYLNYHGGSGHKAVSIHQVKTGGKTYWAYCADMRKDWPDDYTNYSKENVPTSGMYQVQKVAMQLGFGDNNTARLKTMFGIDLNNYEAYQGTQAVLWAAQVWVNQWSYINPAPSSIKKGVTDYWEVSTASGKRANAYNYALKLADAVQAVYKDGISASVAIAKDSEAAGTQKVKITVKPKNYYGGYTAAISGAPSGSTLTSGDGNVTVNSAAAFTSNEVTGTDTLYLTIPRASADKKYTITVTVTPTIQHYETNAALGYLEPADSDYQKVLYAMGNLKAAPVSKSADINTRRFSTGKVTITKLDAETKKPVQGVVFGLYQYNGKDYVATGKTATSNASGIAEFTNLQYDNTSLGRYKVFEVSSDTHEVWTSRFVCHFSLASGLWYSYESATAAQKTGYAEPNTTGSYDYTFSFTAYNKELVKNGSLTIIKKDASGKVLQGTSFQIADSRGTVMLFKKDSTGRYLPSSNGSAKLTTDGNGKIIAAELPLGTYQVTEIAVSNGKYVLLPTSFKVVLPYQKTIDLTYTVINNTQFRLPATGGSGSNLPMILEAELLAAVFVTIQKKSKKEYLYYENA